MELERLFASCTFQEARPDLWGMPCDLWGMSRSLPFGSHFLQGKPSDVRGMLLWKGFRCLEIPTGSDGGRLTSFPGKA